MFKKISARAHRIAAESKGMELIQVLVLVVLAIVLGVLLMNGMTKVFTRQTNNVDKKLDELMNTAILNTAQYAN